MKKKILSILLATAIIGGVGTVGAKAYARYMNRATGQAGITRMVRHGISMDMAVTNPYGDNVILPGDEYPFTVWIENTANYAQSVNYTIIPEFCNHPELSKLLIVGFESGHNGMILAPGQRVEVKGYIYVDEKATNKDIPDDNGNTKSYEIKLGAEVTGTQIDRGSN